MRQSIATNDWEANWLANKQRDQVIADALAKIHALQADNARMHARMARMEEFLFTPDEAKQG